MAPPGHLPGVTALIMDSQSQTPERKQKRSETVKSIRATLGRTQSELATALGISAKAVQSYEQGWREPPTRVMIQLLVLLALYRRQTMEDVPCWEIVKCPGPTRDQCPSFTVGRGQFCWFIGSKSCRPDRPKAGDGIIPCMDCPVIRRILRGPARATETGGG